MMVRSETEYHEEDLFHVRMMASKLRIDPESVIDVFHPDLALSDP